MLDDKTTKKWVVKRVSWTQLEDTLNELAEEYSNVEYWHLAGTNDTFQVTAHDRFDEEDDEFDDGDDAHEIFERPYIARRNAAATIDVAWIGI